jgi:hypothetical protein
VPRLPSLLAISLVAAGCGPWPRFSDLADDTDIVEPGEDPRDLLEIAWERATEEELLVRPGVNNRNPTNVVERSVQMLAGLEVAGTLEGIGWDSSFEPLTMSATCDGERVEVPRDPGRPGDWTGDLDFVRFVVPADVPSPLLCARARFARDDIGFDLLLYPLDACGLPGAPISADGQVLGADRRAPADGWSLPVSPGVSYGLLRVGFTAPEPLDSYPYPLGLSVVPSVGGGEVCPWLPSEVES